MKCGVHLAMILGAALSIASCQSPERVHAAREDVSAAHRYGQGAISGDLYSIDPSEETIVIRVENGMAQTFRWDEDTVIDGYLPPVEPKSGKNLSDTSSVLKRLARHPGSEVEIDWTKVNDEQLATAVHVTSLSPPSSHNLRKRRVHGK